MNEAHALNLEPGQLVGGYTLMSRLGSGAMGSVWRVRDDGGQQYAMKILRDSLAEVPAADLSSDDMQETMTARERLRREAMALQKVRHPGVCAIVDMELDDSLAFIVTELIEGRNLREDVAANGRYVGDDLERLARKLIEAVRAVHAAGIIHRDIKPTNVMVAASGPILVDFGIAMGAGESHVTRTGLVMGTPGFIAPEIIDGAESSDITDWWSLASVLAFAATGNPVFGTKPMMTVLEREASGNANLVGLPARTMAAFRSALHPDPQRRCTPEQLLDAISIDTLQTPSWSDEAYIDSNEEHGYATSEAMRPFQVADTGAATRLLRIPRPDIDNPRSLWRGDDAGTQIIPAMTADDSQPIKAERNGTTPLPVQDPEATTRFPIQEKPPHSAESSAKPALQRIANQSNASAPAADPSLAQTSAISPQATAVMPLSASMAPSPAPQRTVGSTPRTQTMPTDVMQPAPPSIPPEVPQEQAAPQLADPFPYAPTPSATDSKRGVYVQRGSISQWAIALVFGLFGATVPIVALFLALIVTWVLLTLGLNVEAQLGREARRGGVRRPSDAALRVAALPWHALKAALLSIPRILAFAAITVIGTACITLLFGLPHTSLVIPLGPLTTYIPLPNSAPLSFGGITLGIMYAGAWLVNGLGPRSVFTRIGTGAVLGASSAAQQASSQSPMGYSQEESPSATRGIVLTAAWIACILGGVAILITGSSIDWAPLLYL